MILIIDGTIRHQITWDGTAEELRRQAHQWITRGELGILPLAAGSTVAINWRAIRTLQVVEPAALVEDFSAAQPMHPADWLLLHGTGDGQSLDSLGEGERPSLCVVKVDGRDTEAVPINRWGVREHFGGGWSPMPPGTA
jgi:hypothetical protein